MKSNLNAKNLTPATSPSGEGRRAAGALHVGHDTSCPYGGARGAKTRTACVLCPYERQRGGLEVGLAIGITRVEEGRAAAVVGGAFDGEHEGGIEADRVVEEEAGDSLFGIAD